MIGVDHDDDVVKEREREREREMMRKVDQTFHLVEFFHLIKDQT